MKNSEPVKSHFRILGWALMVLLVLLTLQCVCIYLSLDRQRLDLRQEVSRTAQLSAIKVGETLEGARQCLVLLANSPVVQSGDESRVQALFVKFLAQYDSYANFGLIRPDDGGFVSALPVDDRFFSQLHPWMQLFQNGKVSLSDYIKDPIALTEGVNVFLPVSRQTNQSLAGVFATVPVSTLQTIIKSASADQSGIIELFDRSGTIIARNLDPELFRGRRSKNSRQTDPVFIQDNDGHKRLYQVAPVPGSESVLWIAVGLASNEASEKDRIDFLLHVWQVLLIAIVGVWMAWTGHRRLRMPVASPSEHTPPVSILSSHPEHVSAKGHPGVSPLAQTIIDASGNVVCFTSPEGLFLGCNLALERWLAKTKSQIIGKSAAEIFPLELAEHYREIIAAPFSKDAQKAFEAPFACGDGISREVKVVVSPVHDADSKIIGLMSIMTDDTEGRNLLRRIRENEERFRFTVGAAPDAIVVMDEQGKIVLWNQAAETFLGYTPEEAIGQVAHQLLAPPRFHQHWLKHFEAFVEGSCEQVIGKRMELEALKKDGSEVAMEVFVGAVKLDDKWHTIGMMCDMTGRRKAEEALRDSEAALNGAFANSDTTRGTVGVAKENLDLFADGGLAEMLNLNPDMAAAIGESEPASKLWAMKLAKSRASGQPEPFTFIQVFGEKSRPMRAVVNVVSDGSGGFKVAFTTKQVDQDNLEDKLKRTQFAMDRSPQGILWADGSGRFIYANASSVSILGHSRDQLLHMSMMDVDNGATGTWADHWEEVKLRQTLTFESRIQNRDGEDVDLLLTVNYLNIEDCEYACVFVFDNSRSKRSEQEVATLTAELEHRGAEAPASLVLESKPEPEPEVSLSAEDIQSLLKSGNSQPQEPMSNEDIQALIQGEASPAQKPMSDEDIQALLRGGSPAVLKTESPTMRRDSGLLS